MRLQKIREINLKNNKEYDFGYMNEKELRILTKGYTYNELGYYERKNGKYRYIVEDTKEV